MRFPWRGQSFWPRRWYMRFSWRGQYLWSQRWYVRFLWQRRPLRLLTKLLFLRFWFARDRALLQRRSNRRPIRNSFPDSYVASLNTSAQWVILLTDFRAGCKLVACLAVNEFRKANFWCTGRCLRQFSGWDAWGIELPGHEAGHFRQ